MIRLPETCLSQELWGIWKEDCNKIQPSHWNKQSCQNKNSHNKTT